MTDNYTPDQPEPVTPPEVVVADPKRPYKAYAAAFIAVVITVVQAVQAQSADGNWSGEDTTTTILAFLSAALVYFVENPKVVQIQK